MSLPSYDAPDETVPSPLMKAMGKICPKCHSRFEDGQVMQPTCPYDGARLVQTVRDTPSDPMLGRTLDGRFTVTAKLGSGSMGAVYRAKQLPMGRDVAVKILRSDRALDEAAKARFLREARTNSVLVSPHTVTVFDFGESESGELFLAMELLEGESVGQRLTRLTRLPFEAAIDVALQALRSLAEAHAKGIVHRDLKPDNLFFAHVTNANGQPQEIVKVLDFGIAKMLGENIEMNAIETQAGTVFGTPRYMSPEQAQAKTLDGRTDLYSLGVILYHMLAGRPPFTDDDAIIVMARHIKTAPKSFSEVCPEARIPPEIERVVFRSLSKDPTGRPDNAQKMEEELEAALDASRAITSGVRSTFAEHSAYLRKRVSTVPPPRNTNADDSFELPTATSSRAPLFVGVAIGFFVVFATLVFALSRKSAAGTEEKIGATRASASAEQASPPPSSLPVTTATVSSSTIPTAPVTSRVENAKPTSRTPHNAVKPPTVVPQPSSSTSRYGTFE